MLMMLELMKFMRYEQQYFNLTAVQYPEISNEYYSLY